MARSMLLLCAACWCLFSIAAGSLQEKVAKNREENNNIPSEAVEGASLTDTRAAEPTGQTTDDEGEGESRSMDADDDDDEDEDEADEDEGEGESRRMDADDDDEDEDEEDEDDEE